MQAGPTPHSVPGPRRRLRIRVTGTVQGVGFRPSVYRLAASLGLVGHVLNDAGGVLIEVEGNRSIVQRFLDRLPVELPPLVTIERLITDELAKRARRGLSPPLDEPPPALYYPAPRRCASPRADKKRPGGLQRIFRRLICRAPSRTKVAG